MVHDDSRFKDFDEFELPYDLGEVSLTSLLPAGSYLMEIADVRRFINEGAEYASTVVTFKVIDVSSADEKGLVNRQISDFITDDPKIDWKMARFMEAVLGHAPTGRKVKKSELVGRRCVCDVTIREYTKEGATEATKTNQIKSYYKPSFWQATESDKGGLPADTEIDGI